MKNLLKMEFTTYARALLFVTNFCKISSNVMYVSTNKQPICFQNSSGAVSRLYARPTG
jgi:hypothetical protein